MSLFGLLNVDKPAGCSSRHVVDVVERLVRPAKAGHAGTLDPLATGVLVICVGKATRLISYVQQMPKRYRATFQLGRHSETDDIEGEVVELRAAPVPTIGQIDETLRQFLGEIEQVPPLHSAVKVGGRRAYALARRGKAVELAPRKVTIHGIEVRRYEYPELELEIECGSGTYVRSLGRDLAAALGTAAVMSALKRSAIGRFQIADALALDDVNGETVAKHLLPATAAVEHLPQVTVDTAQAVDLRNGRPIAMPSRPCLETHLPFGERLGEVMNCRRFEPSPNPSLKGRGTFETEPSSNRGEVEQRPEVRAAIGPAGELVALVQEKRTGELWPMVNFAD
jgi:tRNA pseudouridine55 synthase